MNEDQIKNIPENVKMNIIYGDKRMAREHFNIDSDDAAGGGSRW
jgi:hypothetical protein